MSASPPQVSVVIPTRDRLALVRDAVSCALGQDGVDVQVVVVDDGSSDGTPDALEAIGDPRLRVERMPRRGGVARARNAGVAVAAGEWIAFLDDDDLWAPERLSRQLEVAREAGASVAYGSRLVVDAQRRPTATVLAERPAEVPELLRWGNVLGSPSCVMVSADVLRRHGGFDERFSALADWKLWLELAAGERLAACPDALVAYMEHPGNMHRREPLGVLHEYERLRAAGPWELVPHAFLHWLAWELVRAGDRRRAFATYLYSARTGRRPVDAALALAAGAGVLGALTDAPRAVAAPAWLERRAPAGV
jgi:glycosyltransferase involved in cell wall biosynthesis